MTNIERHRKYLDILAGLYARKNHDYGDSFHDSFVEDGLVMSKIRLGDKYSRFKTLIKGGNLSSPSVTNESIEDTLLDLANYAIMTVMELDRQKEEKRNVR